MLQYIITIPSPAAAMPLLPAGAKDCAIQGLILQPEGTNNALMYIGGELVTSTLYMFALLPGDASNNPPRPEIILAPQTSLGQLSELYVTGTAGEILHVTVIPR